MKRNNRQAEVDRELAEREKAALAAPSTPGGALGVEGETAEDPAGFDDPAGRFDRVVEQLGDNTEGYFIRAYKWVQDREGKRFQWGFCTRVQLANFDAEEIADTFGRPGRYQFLVCNPRGKTIRHIEQSFLAPVLLPGAPAAPAPVSPAPSAGGERGSTGGLSFAEMLMLKQVEQQGTLLVALVGGLTGGRSGADIKAADLLSAIQIGKTMSGPSADPESLLSSLREAVQTGMELGRGGGEEKATMFETLAPKVMDLVDRLFSSPGGPGGGETAPAAVPAPGLAPPGAGQPAASGMPRATGESAIWSLARSYAPQILREAESARDPQVWADFVTERIPRIWWPTLRKFITGPASKRLAVLMKIEPRLGAHAEWIDLACQAMLETMMELSGEIPEGGEDEGGADAPAPGNPGGGAGNVGSGAGDPAAREGAEGTPSGTASRRASQPRSRAV